MCIPITSLIVTITCAWLLLKLLMVYSLRLSTQVQIFFLLIYGGTFKAASEASPQMAQWAVCWGPHTGTFVPLVFLFYFFFFPFLLCSFSAFCHFSCQPAQLSSLRVIKQVFKQKTLACFCTSSKRTVLDLEIVQSLSSCLVGYSQTCFQWTNTEARDICVSNQKIKNKTWKSRQDNTKLLPLYTCDGLDGESSQSSHKYCSSQEVACSILSNERTFQTRHCGLWLQTPAHAVLTAKKQAKLFTDSFLTTLAKMSPIPSSYCHPLEFLSTTYPHPSAFSSFSLYFFFLHFLLLNVVRVAIMTQKIHTLLLTGVWKTLK